MRERKPETIIAELRRDLKKALKERLAYHDGEYIQRHRATKAEQECAEWKRRFDALLERTPKVQP